MRDRTAVAIDRQAVDRRAPSKNGMILGFMENARDRTAVFQVVGGEAGLSRQSGDDPIHTILWIINGFSSPSSSLRDGFQRKDENSRTRI